MVAAGVEVEAVVAAHDDLGHEEVGELAGERTTRRAGERPVEVAAVGEVAALAHEAEHVDDRHGHDGAGQLPRPQHREHLSDDLDAVELVAVDHRVQPDLRARPAAVHHRDRQRERRVGGQAGDRDLDVAAAARGHDLPVDRERVVPPGRQRGNALTFRGRVGVAFFSMNSIILPATSTRLAFSAPRARARS